RLKPCINDLISRQALPAIWRGGQPSRIVSASLDMLLKMLSLDFAYARLKDSTGESSLEIARLAQDQNLTAQPQMIGRVLNPWVVTVHLPPLRVGGILLETETFRSWFCDWACRLNWVCWSRVP